MTTPDVPAERGRDELRERLADAAKFLRRCRGTEPVEFFEEHATACEEAAALLARQEARGPDGWAVRMRDGSWRSTVYADRATAERKAAQAREFFAARGDDEDDTIDVLPVYLGAPAPAEATEASDESARCTCEWMSPEDGSVHARWPAVLDARCAVHSREEAESEAALPAEATEARDAMDFCPTCKHPRWTAACQCAPASGEPSGAADGVRRTSVAPVASYGWSGSGAEAVVREAYEVIDELAPQWSGSSIATVLRAYLERMAVPYPWRPIETAPKDGSRVLLAGCGENGGWVCVASWRGGRWRDGDYSIEPPTHWMPLPTAPGAPEKGAGE